MLEKRMEMDTDNCGPEAAADENILCGQRVIGRTSPPDFKSSVLLQGQSPIVTNGTPACTSEGEATPGSANASTSSPFSFVVQQTLLGKETEEFSSSDIPQASLDTFTSDETTHRTRRKRRLGDLPAYCTCPACGVTVRPHELQAHLEQEAKQLDKIPKQVARHSKEPQPSSSTSYTRISSSPLNGGTSSTLSVASGKKDSSDTKTTPASRTEIFEKVKSNRNCRYNTRTGRSAGGQEYREAVCPVCHKQLQGTASELNRHAESCLRKRDAQDCSLEDEEVDVEDNGDDEEEEEYEWGGQTRVRAVSLLRGNFDACGFTTVKPSAEDDEDLNVDGDDSVTYGKPQYSESDIIPCLTDSASKEDIALRRALTTGNEDVGKSGERATGCTLHNETGSSLVQPSDITINGLDQQPPDVRQGEPPDQMKESIPSDQEGSTSQSHDQYSHPTVLDGSLQTRPTDQHHLISVLRQQIEELRRNKCQSTQNTFKCLICMDPYNQPVVSVLCWHVYCEECWLRTLGAKKLCPQCNTITSASDLRKIYM